MPEKSSKPGTTPWWHKPIVWAGGVGTLVAAGVLTGVLVNVLTPPAQKLAESAEPTVTLTPLNAAPRATSVSKRHNNPKPTPTPTTPPLSVVSEDPLNLDDLGVWTFPDKIPFSSSQLAEANMLLHRALVNITVITRLGNYFYSLGGYAINTETQLVIQNNSDQPVSILDLRVIKNCGPPLSGTFFDSPGQASGMDIRIGFNLDSTDTDAEFANAGPASTWKPGYFESRYITFRPGEQRVLNIQAATTKHACNFSYQATVLEGKTKFYQTIDDDGHPFRVSAFSPCSHYASIYIGGALSMLHHHGRFVKKDPKTFRGC